MHVAIRLVPDSEESQGDSSASRTIQLRFAEEPCPDELPAVSVRFPVRVRSSFLVLPALRPFALTMLVPDDEHHGRTHELPDSPGLFRVDAPPREDSPAARLSGPTSATGLSVKYPPSASTAPVAHRHAVGANATPLGGSDFGRKSNGHLHSRVEHAGGGNPARSALCPRCHGEPGGSGAGKQRCHQQQKVFRVGKGHGTRGTPPGIPACHPIHGSFPRPILYCEA